MRIDSTHRPWLTAFLFSLGILAASFVVYSIRSRGGPRGGSLPGLMYGLGGYGLMLYASLLGLRKKVPVWRVGRAQTWMRGHMWLGMLSLPLILFHCGFRWKGPLAWLLMVLLFVSVGSGVMGAAVQHYVPGLMTRSVPMETIYEEIPHIRRQLCDEADRLAAGISGVTEGAIQLEIDPEIRARFAGIYEQAIRPTLVAESGKSTDPAVFDSLRRILPAEAHSILADLENICEEERQIRRQRLIHLYLHGWLLVHVPFSITLLVLGAVHAFMAVRF